MLLKLATVGALAFAGYKYYSKRDRRSNVAFDKDQPSGENFSQVRDAGPGAMRDKPDTWDQISEESDESFPASDPPANY